MTTLAVLAGGEGSRMGRPKAELDIRGKPILQFLLERWNWQGPTLLVTAPGREHPPAWKMFDREVSDAVAGEGPLRGILTALEKATTPSLVVTTVDMVGIGSEQLNWLTRWITQTQANGLMLRHPELEPFPIALTKGAHEIVVKHLASGKRAVHSLAQAPGFGVLDAPVEWNPIVWTNLNTPDDFDRFVRAL